MPEPIKNAFQILEENGIIESRSAGVREALDVFITKELYLLENLENKIFLKAIKRGKRAKKS